MVSTRSTTTRVVQGLVRNKPRYRIGDSTHRHRIADRKPYNVSIPAHRRRKPVKS